MKIRWGSLCAKDVDRGYSGVVIVTCLRIEDGGPWPKLHRSRRQSTAERRQSRPCWRVIRWKIEAIRRFSIAWLLPEARIPKLCERSCSLVVDDVNDAGDGDDDGWRCSAEQSRLPHLLRLCQHDLIV